jgi:hypothetical protein
MPFTLRCECRNKRAGIAAANIISNNPSFRLKHPDVPDGSDGSDGTSYPLTENYTLPIAQATGRFA